MSEMSKRMHAPSTGVQQLRLVQHALLAQRQAHGAAPVQCVRPVLRKERQAPPQCASPCFPNLLVVPLLAETNAAPSDVLVLNCLLADAHTHVPSSGCRICGRARAATTSGRTRCRCSSTCSSRWRRRRCCSSRRAWSSTPPCRRPHRPRRPPVQRRRRRSTDRGH